MNYEEFTLNQLVLMAKEEDQEAMERVINKFMPFIYKMIGGLYIKDMDNDDLKQMGCISVIHAVKKFNIEKTKNFTSYVTMAIRNNYYNEIRKKSKENYSISLETPVAPDLTLQDMLQGDFDLEGYYLKLEELQVLKEVIKELSKEERELLYYIYKNPKKAVGEYAKKSSLSTSGAYKRKVNLFKKMRKLLKNQSI